MAAVLAAAAGASLRCSSRSSSCRRFLCPGTWAATLRLASWSELRPLPLAEQRRCAASDGRSASGPSSGSDGRMRNKERSDERSASGPSSGFGGRLRNKERPSSGTVTEEDLNTHMRTLRQQTSVQDSSPKLRNFRNQIPSRFRIKEPSAPGKQGAEAKRDKPDQAYSDYAGLRFPTLETAENYDYHKDRGLTRLIERAYPIKVPGYRRLDPYLREYIFFLHNVDPARFTITRIAERYRMREGTVAKVVNEWGANRYLTRSGLTRLSEKTMSREAVILAKKEEQYAKWVGWDQLGDEDDPDTDDEAIGEFKGWRSTSDWVRRQTVEVEMMSAFPMMEKRDPMPRRVDVDMVVDSKQNHKIMNWIDPSDKVVF